MDRTEYLKAYYKVYYQQNKDKIQKKNKEAYRKRKNKSIIVDHNILIKF